MGIFDRLAGHHESEHGIPPMPGIDLTDREAITQYRTLLQSASPETIEMAHASAFAQLSPVQRQAIYAELCHEAPSFEWETGVRFADEPRSLARMATRAELEHPGTLERILLRPDLAIGEPSAGAFAGMVVGSWAACEFFVEHMEAVPIRASFEPRKDVPPSLGQDVVLDEQPMRLSDSWRQFDHGHS